MGTQSHGSKTHSLGYDSRAAEVENSISKTTACGFAGPARSRRLFIWFSVKDPLGKAGQGEEREISVFTPVKITPLPRRGSPLALILRGILVAAVAMAFLATLAVYTGSETLGAPLPLACHVPGRAEGMRYFTLVFIGT